MSPTRILLAEKRINAEIAEARLSGDRRRLLDVLSAASREMTALYAAYYGRPT